MTSSLSGARSSIGESSVKQPATCQEGALFTERKTQCLPLRRLSQLPRWLHRYRVKIISIETRFLFIISSKLASLAPGGFGITHSFCKTAGKDYTSWLRRKRFIVVDTSDLKDLALACGDGAVLEL